MNLLDKLELKDASGMLLNPTEYDDDLNNESDRFNKVIILNKDVISNIDG